MKDWPKGFENGRFRIVAFLQNAYFHKGHKYTPEEYYTHSPIWTHRRGVVLLVSKTGRNLQKTLGELYNVIYWSNASSKLSNNAREIPKPDYDHIHKVLRDCCPSVVLCFGGYAQKHVKKALSAFPGGEHVEVINLKHPSPRSVDFGELEDCANRLAPILAEYKHQAKKTELAEAVERWRKNATT